MIEVECPICHGPLDDEMGLMIDTDRGLMVVCWKCDERKDEGLDDADRDE